MVHYNAPKDKFNKLDIFSKICYILHCRACTMQLRHTQFSEKLDERRQAMVKQIIMLLIALDLLLVALNLLKS